MAERDDPLGVFIQNGVDDRRFGVNALSSEEIRKECQWTNVRKPNCGANEIFRRNDGACNNLVIKILLSLFSKFHPDKSPPGSVGKSVSKNCRARVR